MLKGCIILNLVEKTLQEREIYKGRIITLNIDKVELPNGNNGSREFVRHPGGVGVVALTKGNEVLLVNQYRYPYKSELMEIPAGKLDPGEDPLECGKRELREETGATASEYSSLGRLFPSPGYTNEIIYMYLAKGLTIGEMQLDDDEFINVVKIPLKKAVGMVMSGELADSKTQTALLKTWFLLNK
jgi:ADP-ribose pyrophosphatase